jgi:hypothetical protein
MSLIYQLKRFAVILIRAPELSKELSNIYQYNFLVYGYDDITCYQYLSVQIFVNHVIFILLMTCQIFISPKKQLN